jgi:hypothetical protein
VKPLGAKKTRTHVKGHQNCAICHPAPKGGRASEKRIAVLIAELDHGSADDALREANRIRASLPRGTVGRG